jgi:hypothetical protein
LTAPTAVSDLGPEAAIMRRRSLARLRLFVTGAVFVLLLAGTGFGVVRCVLVRSAPGRAQNLFIKAEATSDAAAAIHFYAESIRARTQYGEVAPELLVEPRSRIEAKARRRVDDLLRARRVNDASRFVAQIRADLRVAGLEAIAASLEQTIAQNRP